MLEKKLVLVIKENLIKVKRFNQKIMTKKKKKLAKYAQCTP